MGAPQLPGPMAAGLFPQRCAEPAKVTARDKCPCTQVRLTPPYPPSESLDARRLRIVGGGVGRRRDTGRPEG
eukprot:1754988-Rhodomonas_salina.2